MKKRNSMRKEKSTMDEVRLIGYCAECGNDITDDMEDIYVDEDGNYFCSDECGMIYHGLHKLEV